MSRPKGAKNVREQSDAVASRCPRCSSTDSIKLGRKQYQPFAGLDANGQPFDAICRQRVQCTHCGQTRIDRTLTFQGRDPDPA
jgi:DNA-directed RNA polymerase subunit RPC12/RpoP